MSIPALRVVLPSLLVGLGLAGFMHLRAAREVVPRDVQEIAEGNWYLRTEPDGEPRNGRPPGSESGIELLPGTSFRLVEEDYELQRYAMLSFALQVPAPETTTVQLALRETPEASVVLELHPADPLTVRALLLRKDRETAVLASASRPGLLSDPTAPFLLIVRLQGGEFTAAINGEPVLTWSAPGLRHGNLALRVSEGSLRVQRLAARGKQTSQHGMMKDFSISDELTDPPPEPAWPTHRGSLLCATAAGLLAALFLRALCLAPPGGLALASATLVWLCGPALPLALQLFKPVPFLTWVCLVLAALTLPLALSLLKPALHGPPARGRARSACALLLVLAIGGLATWLCCRQSVDALKPVIERELAAQHTPLAPPWTEGAITLDPANALQPPAAYRDLDLHATVLLGPNSALGVRLRAPDPQLPRGVLFTLSADPRVDSGFLLEDLKRLQPLGPTVPPLPDEQVLDLRLQVRGTEYVATLNGEELMRVEQRSFAAGNVVLLALRGTLRLTDVTLTPVEADTRLPSRLGAGLTAAILPLALLSWALLAAWLLRHPLLGVLHAAVFALLPVAAGFALAPFGLLSTEVLLAMGAGILAVLAICALVHGPHAARPFTTTSVLLLGAAGVCASLPLAVEPAAVVDSSELNRMTCADWSVRHLHDELLYLEHPLLRRWNDYLARHRFRERSFSVERRPGIPRVMTLGGSSTWGYRIPPESGADWPGQLERRLGGPDRVEVINAGFVGATSNRLFRFFRDALLPFAPDVVVLSVGFNDSSSQAQGDEEGYFAAMTAPGHEHSWLDDWNARREHDREGQALTAVITALPRDPRPTLQLWRAAGMTSSPPERFEAVLREFAELCRQRRITLVLVKEAIAGDQRLVWKEEFQAAMDRVGAEYDLTVVDPTTALQTAGGRELFMDRVHLKPTGCAVVAEEIARAVGPLLPAH